MTNPNRQAEVVFNNKLAKDYFDIWETCPIQQYTNEIEADFIGKYVPDSSRVLVAGSGGGRELPALVARRCKITAVDISPAMIEAGKQRYPNMPIEWVVGDIHHLSQPDGSYEAIIALGAVYNYLDDPAGFLKEAHRVLAESGVMVLAVLNNDHASERHGSKVLRDGRVRNLYKRQDVEKMLVDAGFGIRECRGVRYLVDMLPSEWNRRGDEYPEGREILRRILREEPLLTASMQPEKAKFLLFAAAK